MDELIIDDKKYLSSKQAAKITGYAKDYVGQLCREGRVEARLVGRSWYVLEGSIRDHRFAAEQAEGASQPTEGLVEGVYEQSGAEVPSVTEHDTTPLNHSNVTYISEEPVLIPELSEKDEPEAKQEPESPSEPTSDMQTVWHEWFNTRRTELQIAEEEPESVPEEEIEESESHSIPVHRDYTSHTAYAQSEVYSEPEERVERPSYESEARIEEDFPRPLRARPARMPQMSYTLLRAGVIGLTIIVVGITAISVSVTEDNRALFGGSSAALDLVSGVYYAQK